MAQALQHPAEATILTSNPLLTFRQGPYSYTIRSGAGQSLYTVTDGHASITAPLLWAFGLGSAGQTYVFEQEGHLYESRVSYYREVKGLDLTLGAGNSAPASLLEAAGKMMQGSEAARCFGCHATNAVQNRQVALDSLTPGLQCARCHAEAVAHLASLRTSSHPLPMRKLGAMTTEETSNFCGQCHRTWAEIAAGGETGLVDVRFQPFGLTNSKCYDAEDKRISCVACHNPHQEIDRIDLNYDTRCLACHSASGKMGAKICHVATSACVGCHMPKVDLPGAHHKFTDHEIRIVRTNAAAVH